MDKWPTVEHLSQASLEEVNEMWSGLGYYSRAKRLQEGAKKVVEEMKGNLPTTAADLLKQLPGVGRYTAGAIASIAYGECTGVVDGNVIRVLARLCSIGAQSSSNQAMETFWELANKLVPEDRPGDFNQALMEFGATLCTPQSPQCIVCPLRTQCSAFKRVEEHKTAASMLLTGKSVKSSARLDAVNGSSTVNDTGVDIEDCNLCLPSSQWDVSLGVCNYPHKPKKKQAKEETLAVAVVERESEEGIQFLTVQRPKTGLLAGLWEFPNISVESELTEAKMYSSLNDFVGSELGVTLLNTKFHESIGEVSHQFSHIHHKYVVYSCKFKGDKNLEQTTEGNREIKWISREGIAGAALSTAMRKVFSAFEKYNSAGRNERSQPKGETSKKRKRGDCNDGRKQMILDTFFKSKN